MTQIFILQKLDTFLENEVPQKLHFSNNVKKENICSEITHLQIPSIG